MKNLFRLFLILVILILLLIGNCKKSNNINDTKNVDKNGKLFFNHSLQSVDDEIRVELDSLLKIQSIDLEKNSEILFSNFDRDENGDIYLLDGSNVRIYIFDSNGIRKLSKSLKGSGPGEFSSYPDIQISNNFLWLIGNRKIAKFTRGGNFVNEIRLKNHYSTIKIIDDQKAIATKEIPSGRNQKTRLTKKVLGLFRLPSEENIHTYLESYTNGRLMIRIGDRPMSIIPDPGVIPDVIFGYDQFNNCIVYSESDEFKVVLKSIENKPISEYSFQVTKTILTDMFKKEIVGSFGNVPPEIEKLILKALPEHFASIKKIRIFLNGLILLESMKSLQESEFYVFDPGERHLKKIRFSFNFNPDELKFYGKYICALEQRDEVSIFHQYKIVNSLGLF